MAGENNLIPNSARTPEERKAQTSKAGKASGKARRKKRAIRDSFEAILSMSLKDGDRTDVDDIQSYASIKGKNITVQDAINIAVLNKALKGDVRAAEYIRDTVGQKPADRVEVANLMDESIKEMEDYIEQQKKGRA